MKIEELRLIAYGPHTKTTLNFAASPDFHVIHGPNEAGKSSSRRALLGLLFGMGHRVIDDQKHKSDSLRVGAKLIDTRGNFLEITRRRGKKTLYDFDDLRYLGEDALKPFLGQIDEDRYANLFGLDHDQLREGGEVMASGGGELAESMVAADGLAGLTIICRELDAQLDLMFTRGSKKKSIDLILTEWKAAKEQVKINSLTGDFWHELTQELETARTKKHEVDERIKPLKAETSRLQALISARPTIEDRVRALSELEELGEFLELDDNFIESRRASSADKNLAEGQLKTARAQAEQITTNLQQLPPPAAVLAEAETIAELLGQKTEHARQIKDRSTLATNLDHNRKKLAQTLEEIRPGMSVADIDQLRMSDADRRKLEKLNDERLKIFSKLEDAQAKLQALPDAVETNLATEHVEALKVMVQRIRKSGDLELLLATQESEAAQARAKVEAAVKKLGLWTGAISELANLPLPLAETMAKFEKLFAKREKMVDDATLAVQKAERDLAGAEREVELLQAGGRIPSESDLIEARAARDAAWRAYVKASSETGAQTVETAIRVADDISDRLRREADRVAKLAQSELAVLRARKDLELARTSLLESQKSHAHALAEWVAQWAPMGIEPLSPSEMRSWVEKHMKITDLMTLAESAEHKASTTEALIHKSLGDLAAAMRKPDPKTVSSLNHALDLADLMIERATKEADRAAAKSLLAGLQKELDELDTDWLPLVGRLGLDTSSTPEHVRETQTKTENLLKLQATIAGDTAKLKETEDSITGFRASTFDLAKRIEQSLDENADLLAWLAEIEKSLQAARMVETQRKAFEKQLLEIQRSIENAAEMLTKAEASLDAFRAEAKCQTIDELPEAERKSTKGRVLRDQLAAYQKQLTSLAGSTPLDQFILESESTDQAQIEEQVAENMKVLTNIQEESERLIAKVAELELRQRLLEQKEGAVKAAAEQAVIEAKLQSEVDKYVRLKITRKLLFDALESYRDRNHAPVLKRAGDIFRSLTLGSFESIRTQEITEQNKPKQVIVGVRHSGNLFVKEMSDGTKDALFLALRIAAIEEYVAKHQPLPVIADDLLINLDDQRGTAALKLLAELATKTQVLLFTHHLHVCDRAKEVLRLPEGCLHTLSGRTVPELV